MGVHSWPSQSEELKKFYPTDTLVTGPDIIFFWVARMIITGCEFMDEVPFKDVYFTSILRDESGKKLSKSLGNSPDPIELFNEFGTDAVRFGIMLMAPQGLDVLFSKDRLEIGRNFMNKLWNACRFIEMNIDMNSNENLKLHNLDLPDKWILDRLTKMVSDYNSQMERFHFNEAAKVLYEFTWSDFCDWYVEIAKIRFYGGDESKSNTARAVSIKCIRTVLTLLHPFAPFITEELWHHFSEKESSDLIISNWVFEEDLRDLNAEEDMSILKDLITSIRSIRSRMNVPHGKHSDLFVRCTIEQAQFLYSHQDLIKTLCRVEKMSAGVNVEKPAQSGTAVCAGMEVYIPLQGLVDLGEEKDRMKKRISEIERLLSGINSKLANENFLERAPKEVINKERSNLSKLNEELEKITSNLDMLI
jgi:valyl-tRNA synthetase